MSKQIINGVEVTEENGVTHFKPIDKSNVLEKVQPKKEDEGFFSKLFNWFKTSDVTPYVKCRNLSDPFGDKNYDGGCKKGYEIGIKIKF